MYQGAALETPGTLAGVQPGGESSALAAVWAPQLPGDPDKENHQTSTQPVHRRLPVAAPGRTASLARPPHACLGAGVETVTFAEIPSCHPGCWLRRALTSGAVRGRLARLAACTLVTCWRPRRPAPRTPGPGCLRGSGSGPNPDATVNVTMVNASLVYTRTRLHLYTVYTARTLGCMTEPTPGQRLATARTRKGYSQEQLAAVASVSLHTIKSVETGRRRLNYDTAVRLAPVLGVTDLGELMGSGIRYPLDARQLASHPAIPEVRKALTSWRPELGGQAETGQYLRGAVDSAWNMWHTSPNQRTETARILPSLLDATRRSARLAEGSDRPLVLAMEAQAYHLAQAFLAWHGERELVYLTVDRGMLAANESGDPLAIGSSVWYAAAVLRAVGRADEALDGLAEARALIDRAEPGDGGRALERAAVLADLWLRSALTKARAGDRSAWQDLDAAAEIVYRDLPEDYTHPWTRVGRVLLDVKRVMLAVEFGDPEEARRVAESIDPQSIPSTERRARHLIEVARGLNMEGSPEAVLLLLQQAAAISPETVAFTPAGRDLTMKLVKVVGKTQRADVLALAARIGLEV